MSSCQKISGKSRTTLNFAALSVQDNTLRGRAGPLKAKVVKAGQGFTGCFSKVGPWQINHARKSERRPQTFLC